MKPAKTFWTRRKFMKMSALAAFSSVTGCTPAGIAIDGEPSHHTTTGFRNYPPAPKPATPGFSFMFRRIREFFNKPEIPAGHVLDETHALSDLNRFSSASSLTWIGHTTYLLKLGDSTLLLDPFFNDVASPLPIGPERYVPPGIRFENLPRVDGLVISHNHYDHLDADAVENLPGRETLPVFVPLGLNPFFVRRGYRNIHELDWHQTAEINGIRLTALPAVHFSGRGLGDRNETLWCSWAIQSEGGSCFFAGDTAYSPTIFREIGNRFRGFDFAIVPIGAYDPPAIMKPVHTNPEEAIQVANDVKADLIIPSHWGTIILTDESPWEPPERYRNFAVKSGISDGRAAIMKIGETRPV